MAVAKQVHDDVLDAALDKIATCTSLYVCSGESNPATKAAASANALATHTLSGGDFANGDGDGDGRKVTVAEQADIAIDTSGDATCLVFADGSDILYITTCTLQSLTSGGTVTVPTFDIEIADPT